MKRSQLTALSLLASMLVSCGGTGTAEQTTAADTTAPESVETTSMFVEDELPELDFKGAKVNFLVGNYANAYWGDFYAEEETGNRINDMLYSMKLKVNERLGVDIEFICYDYTWGNRSEYFAAVTSTILAGSDDYDIQAGDNFVPQQMESEYFKNLAENKYIDFSKPWWNSTYINEMPSSSKIHFATGDGTLAAIKHTFCIFTNQKLLEEYKITDNLYEVVENGEWTLEKLDSYAKLVASDVNGNGEKDFGDVYGLTFGDSNKYLGFLNSLGGNIVTKAADGYAVALGNERAVNIVERMCALIHNNEYVYPAVGNTANSEEALAVGGGNFATKVFIEGRSAFSCGLVQDAATIVPSVDFNVGILPYPKWDESEEYCSPLQRNAYFTIPVSCKDFDMSGAVLEAWSSLAYRELQPEYFEVSMKTRYTSDDGSARMFDLIRNSIFFDIGEILCEVIDSPNAQFRDYIGKNDTSWVSYVEGKKDGIQARLDEAYESLK